ncbi:hypothetical protein F2Q70_00044969, partial [Brassica cretica]
ETPKLFYSEERERKNKTKMENMLGLLRLHVIKGVNLAIRDSKSSDPYVIVRMGQQVYPRLLSFSRISSLERKNKTKMENMLGLLRLHVIRGVNLAIRDSKSSDPYVIVRMGRQKLRTRVVKKNLNPEWNEDLTLSISDPVLPIKIVSGSNITTTCSKIQNQLGGLPEGTVITKIQASRQNCLSEESKIVWNNGKIVQKIFLKLQNVECGEVELQLEWIDVSGLLSINELEMLLTRSIILLHQVC